MVMREALNKFEAGALIKRRREELGLTQDEVVENTTIPVATYVSELENGKVSVGRSKHFASLAKYLKLSENDIRAIQPGAVFEFPKAIELSTHMELRDNAMDAVAPAGSVTLQTRQLDIPASLLEAAEIFGARPENALLRNPRVQQMLVQGMSFGSGPETAEDWYDYFRSIKKYIKVD